MTIEEFLPPAEVIKFYRLKEQEPFPFEVFLRVELVPRGKYESNPCNYDLLQTLLTRCELPVEHIENIGTFSKGRCYSGDREEDEFFYDIKLTCGWWIGEHRIYLHASSRNLEKLETVVSVVRDYANEMLQNGPM